MKLYKEDLTGRAFGDLIVLSFIRRKELNIRKQTTPLWLCKCVCGNTREVVDAKLKNGTTVSCKPCGIKRIGVFNSGSDTGLDIKVSSERLHRIWIAMKQRCSNQNTVGYKNYGGKGVIVCTEWSNSYKSFREWALECGYSETLTIDRKDFTGNYEPSNCRWVTLEDNNKESFERHYSAKTGIFSKESYEKVRVTNKTKLGCKFNMYLNGQFISKWECLIDCAEYICNVKGLKTKPLQIKKNISACLHNKRASCHGYAFKLEEF